MEELLSADKARMPVYDLTMKDSSIEASSAFLEADFVPTSDRFAEQLIFSSSSGGLEEPSSIEQSAVIGSRRSDRFSGRKELEAWCPLDARTDLPSSMRCTALIESESLVSIFASLLIRLDACFNAFFDTDIALLFPAEQKPVPA
jgi:hypothetical protein